MAAAAAAAHIRIDGSILEGGGQILRNAFASCCLLQRPVVIHNIRGSRNPPGLRAQHTQGLVLVNEMCKGDLHGAKIGSCEVTFSPGRLQSGEFTADTGTAGSIALLLQVSLPCTLYSPGPSKIKLIGGTNADFAPQIDYMQLVLLPVLARMGIEADIHVDKRGYYPRGQGIVSVSSKPLEKPLAPIELCERGEVTRVFGVIVASGMKRSVPERALRAIQGLLRRSAVKDVPTDITVVMDATTQDAGFGVVLVAETSTGCRLAGSALGKKGKAAEQVGEEAAQALLGVLASGACVDEYLQDQLIIFMALAAGHSRIKSGEITLHTQTAIKIVGDITAELMVRFNNNNITGCQFTTTKDGELFVIECDGIGLARS